MNSGRVRVLFLVIADLSGLAVTVGAMLYLLHICCNIQWRPEEYYKMWPLPIFFVTVSGFVRLYHGNMFYPGAAIGPIEELRRIFFAVLVSFLAIFAYVQLGKKTIDVSRWVMLGAGVLSLLTLPVARYVVRRLLKKWRIGQIKTVIFGAGRVGRIIGEELQADIHFGLCPVGFFDDCKKGKCGDLPILGNLAEVNEYAKKKKINYGICCLPPEKAQEVVRKYGNTFLHLTFIPDTRIFPVAWAYPLNLHGHPGVELRNQLLLPGPRKWKAGLEFFLSIFALVIALPLMLMLAILVKLTSRGPIFYAAKRLGKGGREIKVLKFRTMYRDADERLSQMLEQRPELKTEWESKFKLEKDPRITGFGKFLRKTSLDELPQFLNVLKGEMAVIGPRPIVRKEIGKYGDRYELLKQVKPGITGLWQVSGRSEVSYSQRVNLDANYIMNWTIWMDYYILLKTVKEILFAKGC